MNRDAGSSDGRNIDPRSGILEGEAAGQAVPRDRLEAEGGAPFEVWDRIPSADRRGGTYYDRPVLKEPVWIWAVPAYFYAGGAAGAAAVLGAAAQFADRDGLEGLIKRCRWIATAGGAVGTALLVHDLGRPGRFLNMLRVFRATSPMSVGSWVLAGCAPLAAGSAIGASGPRVVRSVGDIAGLGAGVLGLPLAGYTAVLLSNTAVPVWQQARRSLPAVFYSSAVTSTAALLDLTDLSKRESAVVHRFGVIGKTAELLSLQAVEREAGGVERVADPLKRGLSGALWRASKMLVAGSLVLSVLPGHEKRHRKVVGALLGTAGSLAVRFALFHAGKASARDPLATFEGQRAGLGAAEVMPSPRG
jgi:formate-dependent nitrite reductase membrane component NrfD